MTFFTPCSSHPTHQRSNRHETISILLRTKTCSLVSRCVTRQLTPFLQTAVPYSTAYCTSHEFLHSCTRHKARVSKYSYQTNKQKTRLLREVNIHSLLAELVDEKERKKSTYLILAVFADTTIKIHPVLHPRRRNARRDINVTRKKAV
jgi:hypothetical protein